MASELVVQRELEQDIETQLDDEIAERVASIRALQQQAGEMAIEIDALKLELHDLLTNRGSNWSDDKGYARSVSEGLRTSYETKMLDDLIIKDPLHYGWLKDYRKETLVRGGVQVK